MALGNSSHGSVTEEILTARKACMILCIIEALFICSYGSADKVKQVCLLQVKVSALCCAQSDDTANTADTKSPTICQRKALG